MDWYMNPKTDSLNKTDRRIPPNLNRRVHKLDDGKESTQVNTVKESFKQKHLTRYRFPCRQKDFF